MLAHMRRLAGIVLTAIILGALVMLLTAQRTPAQPGTPATATAITLDAKVTTCKTTHSYSYASSYSASAGTTTAQTWTTKEGCGSAYQEWKTEVSQSTDGAHYTADTYRDERSYPSWWQQVQKWAWSKTGAFKYTSTVTTG